MNPIDFIDAGDLKKGLPRLQSAPHAGGAGSGDPHDAGLALDIILFASTEYERNLADQIVQAFLNMREDMRWAAVI